MSAGRDLQVRVAALTQELWPDSVDVWRRLSKLTEEVGELNRAIIGEDEGRPDRGVPEEEAVQALVVLLSIVGLHYPHLDLIAEAEAYIVRFGEGR